VFGFFHSPPIRQRLHQLLDKANPVFALTVQMKTCQGIFRGTIVCYCLALAVLLISILLLNNPLPTAFIPIGLSPRGFFELGFLLATCCSVVFLGSDFGVVFIEAAFQDELLRLTPLTPLQIVHGGIYSSLFFSFGLLCPAFPVFIAAFFLQLPVERIFFGTLLLFGIGQSLNLILISCYILARSWKDIGFGSSTAFLFIILLIGFGFTKSGQQLFNPVHWKIPMTFLFVVFVATICIAYCLARSHANTKKRTFKTTVLINAAVYIPFLIIISATAIFW
jgi:hypothetical protein